MRMYNDGLYICNLFMNSVCKYLGCSSCGFPIATAFDVNLLAALELRGYI
jgi:hypothetical protein